jgi:hypothetical protein
MSQPASFLLDLVAIGILAFGIYFPRYHRRDMLLAFVGLNIGVMAVAVALISTEVGAGVGLGLFGVLSIIRLRSSELNQQEVAYYFSALALGLLGGVQIDPEWLSPALSAALLIAVFLADHPRLFQRYRDVALTLDRAFTDERELIDHVAGLLGAEVCHVDVKKVDLVNDTTVVEVRYRLHATEVVAAPSQEATVDSRAFGRADLAR